jgi:hypothetical protein
MHPYLVMIQGKYPLTNFLRSSFWLRCTMTRDVIAFCFDLFVLMAPCVKNDGKKCCECHPKPKKVSDLFPIFTRNVKKMANSYFLSFQKNKLLKSYYDHV